MALRYFHINTLGSYVMDAWRKHLKPKTPKTKKFGTILPALSISWEGPKEDGKWTGGLVDKVKIPYSAQMRLIGKSWANFPEEVDGKTNHSATAGHICSWIKEHKSAGWIDEYGREKEDGMTFAPDPKNSEKGIASLRGTMEAEQSVNSRSYVVDVTPPEGSDVDKEAKAIIAQLERGETPEGTVRADDAESLPDAAAS